MIRQIVFMWRNHRYVLITFTIAAIATIFFAVRLTLFTIWWSDPAHQNQQIEPWMTPRYVARSYDLQIEDIAGAWGFEFPSEIRRTVGDIADETGLSLLELQQRIETLTQGDVSQ